MFTRHAIITFTLGAIGTWSAQAQQDLPEHLKRQAAVESQPLAQRQPLEDLQAAAYYWYESRNPANIGPMDRALRLVLPKAQRQALLVNDYQTWEEAQNYRAYHDAGAILLAKCYTLLYYGEIDKARPCVKQLATDFPYAMLLRPHRELIWARWALRYHEHMCMLYAALVGLKMETLYFPSERDEFDGPAQRRAVRDMVLLRLLEGNVDAVDRLAVMASEQGLRTTDSTWLIEEVYDAMEPHENTPGAWDELASAVQRWRLKKPDSLQAKIGEARFLMNRALNVMRDKRYSDFRRWTDQSKAILAKLPHDCPGWFSSMIFAQVYAGDRAEDIAATFREGMERYEDYTPLHLYISRSFVKSGAEGTAACAGFIQRLVDEKHPDQAALVLRHVYAQGYLQELMPRLNLDIVRVCLASAIGRWNNSLELRSDLSMVALTLGQQDIARLGMEGMGRNWGRRTWKGREDLAAQLSQPAVRTPKPQGKIVQ